MTPYFPSCNNTPRLLNLSLVKIKVIPKPERLKIYRLVFDMLDDFLYSYVESGATNWVVFSSKSEYNRLIQKHTIIMENCYFKLKPGGFCGMFSLTGITDRMAAGRLVWNYITLERYFPELKQFKPSPCPAHWFDTDFIGFTIRRDILGHILKIEGYEQIEI